MSDDLGPACAELAALIPALIPALSRDSIPPDRRTALSAGLSAGSAVNPDVLHARTRTWSGNRQVATLESRPYFLEIYC